MSRRMLLYINDGLPLLPRKSGASRMSEPARHCRSRAYGGSVTSQALESARALRNARGVTPVTDLNTRAK